MNKALVLNFRRLLFLGIVSIVFLFFLTTNVFSQTASPAPAASPGADSSTTTPLNLTYPITDLGSCANLEACSNFCEDPVHASSCSDYAKKNGFYQDDPTTYAGEEFYQDAQTELGCNSKDACLTLCSDPSNHDKCESFARRNDIPGGYVEQPDKPEYLEVAKTVLGCDSADSCSNACDDPANAQKCSDFANQVGLLGGTTTEGPGGCQTPETCGAYCSDPANFEQCKTEIPGGNFSGPGGCNSEETCRSYCDQNPESCRSYAPGSSGTYVPVACGQGEYYGPGGVCTATSDTQAAANCVSSDKYWGTNCQDTPPVGIDPKQISAHFEPRPEMGNCATPGECYDYCKENPGKCEGFDASGARPTDDYTPYLYYTPGSEVKTAPNPQMGNCDSPAACYDYCKENPGKCEGFSDKAPRPPAIYIPGTYYTPPIDTVYVTPSLTSFYTTPTYYTPPVGSTYTTPQYYTPGMYSTPTYYTPPVGSNYTTPNYYTPWSDYVTPTGAYPTPTYSTPTYYTPPGGGANLGWTGYTTPYYYTPPTYMTPYYYTPSDSKYTTPSYSTPPTYTTPQYYTPFGGGGYTTPT